jgi:hypothetical protein
VDGAREKKKGVTISDQGSRVKVKFKMKTAGLLTW